MESSEPFTATGSSPRATLSRLPAEVRREFFRRRQSLFHHGYLDRPRAQLDWYAKGSKPMAHALGRRAAKAIGASGSRWTQKNRELGRAFLHHTLAVADTLVRIELACRRTEGIEFVPEEELRTSLPEAARPAGPPLRMRGSFRYRGIWA